MLLRRSESPKGGDFFGLRGIKILLGDQVWVGFSYVRESLINQMQVSLIRSSLVNLLLGRGEASFRFIDVVL